MKLILSHDDGTVIDQWSTEEEFDCELFEAIMDQLNPESSTHQAIEKVLEEVGYIL